MTTIRTSPSGELVELGSNDIANDSAVAGGTVTEALDALSGSVLTLTSSDIANASTVDGTTVTEALDALLYVRGTLSLTGQQLAMSMTGITNGMVVELTLTGDTELHAISDVIGATPIPAGFSFSLLIVNSGVFGLTVFDESDLVADPALHIQTPLGTTLYLNEGEKVQFRRTNDDNWRVESVSSVVDPSSRPDYATDFLVVTGTTVTANLVAGQIADLNLDGGAWHLIAQTADVSLAQQAGTPTNPGILRLTASAVGAANGQFGLWRGTRADANVTPFTFGNVLLGEWVINLSDITSVILRLGFSTDPVSIDTNTNSLLFRYNSSIDGQIRAVARAGGVESTTVLLPMTSGFHKYQMWQASSGRVTFAVDDDILGELTTNIPASASACMQVISAQSLVAAPGRAVDLDFSRFRTKLYQR